MEGVYAAGDVVTGTKSVIAAIAAGRTAAEEIDRYLGGTGNISEVLADAEKPDPYIGRVEGFGELERVIPQTAEPSDRLTGFQLAEQPFSCEQAQCEAGRCLQCDLRLELTKPKLWNEY